ncbi:hypothetical protein [Marinospirillum sp.]|uniref:hypothetical protein n=1 Tax=Marinospirillum sp. TaxID=2183934 RepID=UPI003A89E5B3
MNLSTTQQRAVYLQRLGIPLWVPRYQLPGAAPSTSCDWVLPQPQPSRKERLLEATTALERSTPPKSAPALEQQPAAQAPHPIEEMAPPSATPTPPTEPAAVATALPLQADVWLLANGWQLVLELDAPLNQGDIQLTQNLVRALAPQGVGLVSQKLFSWPRAQLAAGSELDLITSLRTFLTGAQYQQHPIVGLLALGPRVTQLLTEPAAPWPPLPTLYTGPSLIQLRTSAQHKATFWQQAGEHGLRAHFASSALLWP